VIDDSCTPVPSVSASISGSPLTATYNLGDGPVTITDLADFTMGDCESTIQITVSAGTDALGISTLNTGRIFTPTAPYTNSGTETQGSLEVIMDLNDVNQVGDHLLTILFIRNGGSISEGAGTYVELTDHITITVVDPSACTPSLQLPTPVGTAGFTFDLD
jgi:hypothetical protein